MMLVVVEGAPMRADETLLGQVSHGDVQRAEGRAERLKAEWETFGLSGVTPSDVETAYDRWEISFQALAVLKRRRFAHLASRSYAAVSRAIRRFARWSEMGIIATLLLVGTLSLACAIVPLAAFSKSILVVLSGGGITFALTAAVAGFLLSWPADPQFDEWARERIAVEVQIAAVGERCVIACKRYHFLADARYALSRYERAQDEYSRLKRIWQDWRNRLLACNWRVLRGIPFEDFLREVFEGLGYEVRATKASGDQGVDLIVSDERRRIAVQTKGYSGAVGNGAVQEIYAGMVHYGCDECVAITNSYFTPSARELARSTGCRLIDGSQIPDLIKGKVRL